MPPSPRTNPATTKIAVRDRNERFRVAGDQGTAEERAADDEQAVVEAGVPEAARAPRESVRAGGLLARQAPAAERRRRPAGTCRADPRDGSPPVFGRLFGSAAAAGVAVVPVPAVPALDPLPFELLPPSCSKAALHDDRRGHDGAALQKYVRTCRPERKCWENDLAGGQDSESHEPFSRFVLWPVGALVGPGDAVPHKLTVTVFGPNEKS